MEQVGVRKLRDHLSRYLKKVQSGAELEVADRGQVIARMVPVYRQSASVDVVALVRKGVASWVGGKPQGAKMPVTLDGRSVAERVVAERR